MFWDCSWEMAVTEALDIEQFDSYKFSFSVIEFSFGKFLWKELKVMQIPLYESQDL